MLLIDDKDWTPMQIHEEGRGGFRPVNSRLRIFAGGNPLWQWRGSMLAWNKRRKPRRKQERSRPAPCRLRTRSRG